MENFLLTPTNAAAIAEFMQVFKDAHAEVWQEHEGSTLVTKAKIVKNHEHAQNVNMVLCKEEI